MFKKFLLASLLISSIKANNIHQSYFAVVESTPTCYQFSTTAILSTVERANTIARSKCSDEPVLVNIEIDIVKPDSCGAVTAQAVYRCYDLL